ncbi:YceI family protein [Flavobacterium sp.]|uniref:YceI family protein n=1 Tax=Flavobacterium sp. TaxID=239 RepID=UPI003529105C
MKNSFYIIIALVLFGFTSTDKTQVIISEKSQIIINGKSNINSFQCEYNQNLIKSQLFVTHYQKENKILLQGATFLIQTKGFDCAHRIITKDLQSVLKSNEYPNIKIEVNELKTSGVKIIATATITIANVKKTYHIPVTINPKNKNVNGILTLNINDFNLKSPKKILGLIKLNEEVSIAFDLYLKY